MKKYAWTLAELVVAIIIMFMLGGMCVSLYKPDIQKAKFFMYAGISNLTKGNIAIIEKENTIMGGDSDEANNDNLYIPESGIKYDWYCVQLADTFTLKSPAICQRNTPSDTANIEFANGMTIKGLASAWEKPFEEADFAYKNILIDIDGASGLNKIGADQFPMRIIGGSGRGTEGLVMPVNCNNEQVFNGTELIPVPENAKNPYCPESNGKNYTLDENIITYDIYKAENTEVGSKASLVVAAISALKSDCMAYGDGKGYFSIQECEEASIKVNSKCATTDGCDVYQTNTYPKDTTDVATCTSLVNTTNPDDKPCFVVLHKPSGGMSFIIQGIVGDSIQ